MTTLNHCAGMKRKHTTLATRGPRKRPRPAVGALCPSANATASSVDHPVLRRLYPQVLTLRHYLLSQIPSSSRNRRRRIVQFGQVAPAHDAPATPHVDIELLRLLDSALVGTMTKSIASSSEQAARDRDHDMETFSQQRSQSTTSGTYKPGYFLQSEVCRLRLPYAQTTGEACREAIADHA